MYIENKMFLQECARDEESLKKLTQFFGKLQRYRYLSDAGVDAVIIDQGGKIIDANLAAARMFGYGDEEFIGQDLSNFVTPESKLFVFEKNVSQSALPYEVIGIRKDGSHFPIEIAGRQVEFEGETYRLSVIRDITERKRSEFELERSRVNALAIIENTPDPVWSVNSEYRLLTFNTAFYNTILKAYGNHIKLGMHASEIVPEDVYFVWEEMLKRAFKGERPSFDRQIEVNGAIYYFEITLNSIITDGEITGVACFGRDITERKKNEEALINSQANITALIENTNDSIWSVDLEHRLTAYNSIFDEIFFKRFGKRLRAGVFLEEFVPREVYMEWLQFYERAFKGERFVFEYEIEENNEIKFREVSLNPIISGEKITGVTAFGRDITERRRNEEALKTSRANIYALIENTKDLIWSVDLSMRLITYNSAFEDMMYWMYQRKIHAGMIVYDAGNPQEESYWAPIYDRAFKGETFSMKHEYNLGKQIQYAELSFNPIIQENIVTGIVVFSRDMTAYYQAITEKNRLLETQQEHQQAILKAVLNTQEQERKRIAQDIHDGLGQILSAAKLTLRSAVNEMRNVLDDEKIEKAEYGIHLLNEAIEETRTISREIMPSSLMRFGLDAALKDLIATVSKTGDIHIRYFYKQHHNLEKHQEIHIYRIIQEILNNIIKHAEAKEVLIDLVEDQGFLTLIVQDDGVGFDLHTEMMKTGIGLKNIMSRANYLGAGINIDSMPGHGCTISMEFPFSS